MPLPLFRETTILAHHVLGIYISSQQPSEVDTVIRLSFQERKLIHKEVQNNLP